jgi:antitoxin component YwqK of YwqJK toxin-antitoxin module
MSDNWYYTQDGKKKIGPLTFAALQRLASSGVLQPINMVMQEGSGRWAQAKTVQGLFSEAPVQSPASPKVASTDARSAKSVQQNTQARATDLWFRFMGLPKRHRLAILGGGGAAGVVLFACLCCGCSGLIGGGSGRTPQVKLPDFSQADYSTDFSKTDYSIPIVDYTKGPGGQKLVEQGGRMPGGQQTTDQGFVDPQRGFVIHGLRIVWYSKGDKKAAEEYWFDGKKHGPVVSWDERRQKRLEAGCKEGLQHGKATVWDANGKLSEEAYYAMGKKHGTFKSYYPNGQVRQDGAFKNGEYQGKWVSFHKNGKQMSEEFFADGKKHGKVVAWYEDGHKSLERSFVDGRKEGSHVEWYKNGQKKLETAYVEGGAQGSWREWKEDGQVFMNILFVKGLPQFTPRNVTRDVFIRLLFITADSGNPDSHSYTFVSMERFIGIFGEPSAGHQKKRDWKDRSDELWLYQCSDGNLMLTAVFTTGYFVISRVEQQ